MGLTDVGALKQYVDELPLFLVRRFVNEDESALIVISLVADKNLTQLLPIVDQLDQRLNAARAAHAGYTIEVTGHSPIATRNSAGMINKLNRALTVEFAFIAAFIGLAFRSVRIGLACLMAGIFRSSPQARCSGFLATAYSSRRSSPSSSRSAWV